MRSHSHLLFRFFLATFAWTWFFWLFLALISQGVIPFGAEVLTVIKHPLSIVAAFGPMVGALVALRKEGGRGEGRRYLRTFLDLRLGWKGYLFPFLILAGTTAIAWVLPETFGEKRLAMQLPSVWLYLPYLLLMILLGGGQEELGWRGYALPKMEAQMGIWKANFLLGIIWGFWHLPLWFIEGMGQTYMPFSGFVLFTVGSSYFLAWVREISDNKPFAAVFAHGVANSLIPLFPILIFEEGVFQLRFWIWVGLTLVVGIVVTVLRKPGHGRRQIQ